MKIWWEIFPGWEVSKFLASGGGRRERGEGEGGGREGEGEGGRERGREGGGGDNRENPDREIP